MKRKASGSSPEQKKRSKSKHRPGTRGISKKNKRNNKKKRNNSKKRRKSKRK